MAIDIRATVTCSLGTLISGSISDDYLQGSGLVKTKGSCEISALITPAVGTVVTFSYVKGGVTRSIPRKLRVLSSFADPFRRTTKVELGCKLTYLSDLRDPINWRALDDPENAAYNSDDERIVTLPIRASSVMSKCLTELGITASSSPLTNRFSVAEFDFSPGYVQVLGDLLVSESYFGYLDFSEVLQVVSLDQAGGTGPVFTSADIVDLGPIGVGQLPGEAVTVSYSTLKLKEPDGTDDIEDQGFIESNQARLWERSFTIAGPITYYVASRVFNGYETTETLTTYQTIAGSDVPVQRITIETGSSAKIAGSIGSSYEQNGIGFNELVTELRREEELISYDSNGNRIRTEVTQYQQALAIFGGLSLTYVFSASDFVNFSYTLLPSAKTISTFDVLGDRQQETSSTYVLWTETIPGQQAVAEYRDALDSSAEVSAFVNAVAIAGLVHQRTTVSINTTGATQSRPRDILNAAYADGGDPNNGWRTESSAELELALGSATAQRRIEFSLPYAPDDTFFGLSGGPFYSFPSDAPVKANRYGRVQNRLLLGNRSGVNLQVAPEKLPLAPFAPVYLKADGLTALYRANGNQWAFDSNGIVCSTDALFWAAVSGTGSYWFPVAPGVTTLPAEPAIVDGEMNATTIVLPYNETAVYRPRLRVGMVVSKFEYALEVLTELDPLTVTTTLLARSAPAFLRVPATDFTFTVYAPAVSGGGSVSPPVSNTALTAPAPAVSSGFSAAIPATDFAFEASPVPYVGTRATVIQPPQVVFATAPFVPGVSSGATVAPVTVDLTTEAQLPVIISKPAPTIVTTSTSLSGVSFYTHTSVNAEQNDIILMIVETSGEGTSIAPGPGGGLTGSFAAVTGSPVIDIASTAGSKLHAWWLRVASTVTGANILIDDSGDHQLSRYYVIRGCTTTGNPWDTTATDTKTVTSTTASAPAVTTAVGNTLVISAVSRANDSSSTSAFGAAVNSVLSSFTNRGESGTASGNGGGFVVTSGLKQVPGSTGATTFAATTDSTNAAITIAFKP